MSVRCRAGVCHLVPGHGGKASHLTLPERQAIWPGQSRHRTADHPTDDAYAHGSRPKDQLPHARLHDLRHIHATTLLLSGVPVHVVAARLGHADPAITLRVYAHVIRTAEAAAADIFAQAVNAT